MDAVTPKECRAEEGASGAPKPSPTLETLGAASCLSGTDDDEPEAPYVVFSGLAATRYNGRIGKILHAVTDARGVDRWAVRLSSGDAIRVPVDNCIRVTAGEILQWELDGRRAAHQAELATKGEVDVEDAEAEKAQVDKRPFPVPLYSYVLAMDNFFRGRLTTGEEVRVYDFAKHFDQFEVDVCMAVASSVDDASITKESVRKALDSHMPRSARYKAAFDRYVRLAEDAGAEGFPYEGMGSTGEALDDDNDHEPGATPPPPPPPPPPTPSSPLHSASDTDDARPMASGVLM